MRPDKRLLDPQGGDGGSPVKENRKQRARRLIEERRAQEASLDLMSPQERKAEGLRQHRAMVARQAEQEARVQSSTVAASVKPEIKRGPRGGRYTEDTTRDGRPYRRYF
jgi:hypothetical protein